MLILDAWGMVSDGSNELINSARVFWNMRIWDLMNASFVPARGISSLYGSSWRPHYNKVSTPGSKGSQQMPSSQYFHLKCQDSEHPQRGSVAPVVDQVFIWLLYWKSSINSRCWRGIQGQRHQSFNLSFASYPYPNPPTQVDSKINKSPNLIPFLFLS